MHGDRPSETRLALYEEIANSITHFIGFSLSIAGLVLLIVFAVHHKDGIDDAQQILSAVLFGSSMIILYLASTLYHTVWDNRAKRFLRKLDHAAIFILIAGTYTPYLLVPLGDSIGRFYFLLVWGLAIIGIVLKLMIGPDMGRLTVVPYVIMGWLVIFIIRPLIDVVAWNGILWLFAGGLCYTTGIIPFMWEKLPFNHAIWHLFTVAGTICHFFAVFLHITT